VRHSMDIPTFAIFYESMHKSAFHSIWVYLPWCIIPDTHFIFLQSGRKSMN